MSAQQPPFSVNSRWIWPFEILEQIGEGGMGVVYRARYVVNNRHVALKMLPGDVSDKTALARFERELEILKTLRHPNIVRCFGGVCEDKRRFYAMELVEGGSLEDKLQGKGKFPWEQVVMYGLQMCDALEGSHQKGIVHRDVKPSNFLITPAGQIKLSDFGLASVLATRKITAAGKTAGTFLYMAPEQIRGQEITPRTDLYALGCVLYELITGQVPFLGETPAATLHMHCHAAPVRPTQRNIECPLALERIILHLLEKDPGARPESAAAVAKELKSVSQTVRVTSKRHDLLSDEDPPPRVLSSVELIQKKTFPLPKQIPHGAKIIAVLAGALLLLGIWNIASFKNTRTMNQAYALWGDAAKHPDAVVRAEAAKAFSQLAARHRPSLDQLIASVDDMDPRVRIAAINGLQHAGPSARASVATLTKAQKQDPEEQVRLAADRTLIAIRNMESAQRVPWGLLSVTSLIVISAAIGVYVWFRREEQQSALPRN